MARIEDSALNDDVSVGKALRLCVALGGQSGSTELRDWAARELRGYDGEGQLPDYRRVPAAIRIDAIQGNQFMGGAIITGERISPRNLPDVVASRFEEEVELRQPIAEIDQLSRLDDSIKMSLPGGADIVTLMNSELSQPMTTINAVYWSVAPSSLAAVVDQVRTRLVELTAEIRAGLGEEIGLPSSELADEAVRVVIRGNGNRVAVHGARATDGATASMTVASGKSPSAARLVFSSIVGLATIAGSAFALLQFFG